MKEENIDLRKILSMNIKKNRDIIGLSQEKLADKTGISVNMIKDIEGCRTWVSDKTLIKIAIALKIDVYRLLISPEIYEEEIYKSIAVDLVRILKKVKKDVGIDIEKALDMWGLE